MRRILPTVASLTAALFVLMLALDRAEEDSTLGTLADWTWFAFLASALVLVVVGGYAVIGRARAARA